MPARSIQKNVTSDSLDAQGRTGKDSPSRPRRGSIGVSATDNADRRYRQIWEIDGGLILMGLERESGGRPENSSAQLTGKAASARAIAVVD